MIVSPKLLKAAMSKLPALALEFIDSSVDTLRPKTGEVASRHQSRMILMLYFDLVKGGSSENQAKDQVSEAVWVRVVYSSIITAVYMELSVFRAVLCTYSSIEPAADIENLQ